jgi:hypothetical protein
MLRVSELSETALSLASLDQKELPLPDLDV